jgi:hypothetical protein
MSQSKKSSMAEAVINVLIGYGVAIASQIAVFPMFGIDIPLSSNIAIGAWFTAISLARSYIIRRWFNGLARKAADKLTATKGAAQ